MDDGIGTEEVKVVESEGEILGYGQDMVPGEASMLQL